MKKSANKLRPSYSTGALDDDENTFQKFFDEQIHKLNEEILILEKNKDEVYANQARQKIKRFEALSDQFEKIGTERK